MADALEDKINRWLLWAKCEDVSADDLFSQGHRRATDLHRALQISLITFGKQADDLFQSAQSKFATGDLRRSIDLLKRHTCREIRYRQAKELLSRIKETIQSTATADRKNTEAKLLLHEVEDLEICISEW